jgi:hypothetical protein
LISFIYIKKSLYLVEPCSTTPYEDEDPLLCPTGYICHVEKPGNSKKDLPNLGHCIPEKDGRY